MAESKNIEEKVRELASKYDNLEVQSVDFNGGKVVLGVNVKGSSKPGELPPGVELLSESAGHTLGEVIPSVASRYAVGGVPTRLSLDPLTRDFLDAAKTDVLSATPQDLYQRSLDYYKSKDVYGTTINVLTNFASKGFENDINDPTIKNFYDNWVIDTKLDDIVEKIFFDLFRVGIVRTYKIMGKYEPRVNFLNSIPGQKPKKVTAATKKNRFSASHIPLAYTILNPVMLDIKGSLMFGQTSTFLKAKAGEELSKILELPKNKLSTFQRKIIDNLPSDFKKAVEDGDDIPLEADLVGEVDYRRMPYERYPLPRGIRSFDVVELKEELRKADYSTLDGITNYILKITVGNDNHPVRKQEVLESVSNLFNTVSKSFKVVWNHTLDVEKITSPEVGQILGPEKYVQVNLDTTGALGIVRALLDGSGDIRGPAADLAVKSIIEEINYARRQVTRWIYNEYRQVAEAMKFDRFPRVRFDDMALRDELAMMSIIQGMIDRRIISYRTGQRKLGFDPDTEKAQLEAELPDVLEGKFGLVGSPFQQSGIQSVQRTPKGTPSEGRPKGQPAKTPEQDDTKPPTGKKKDQLIDNTDKASAFSAYIEGLSIDQLNSLADAIVNLKKEKAVDDE